MEQGSRSINSMMIKKVKNLGINPPIPCTLNRKNPAGKYTCYPNQLEEPDAGLLSLGHRANYLSGPVANKSLP